MKITVLGGTGASPVARGACSGYLVESAWFCLLIDAVLVSHGHPDHCADLKTWLEVACVAYLCGRLRVEPT